MYIYTFIYICMYVYYLIRVIYQPSASDVHLFLPGFFQSYVKIVIQVVYINCCNICIFFSSVVDIDLSMLSKPQRLDYRTYITS